MVVSYVGIIRQGEAQLDRAGRVTCLVTAGSAAVLTVLVLGPLLYSGKFSGVIGYPLWVGAAALLVSAAWPVTVSHDRLPEVSGCKVRPKEFMQAGDSPDFFK